MREDILVNCTPQETRVAVMAAGQVQELVALEELEQELTMRSGGSKPTFEQLAELWRCPEVVAVGECGLDYYYDHSPRELQRQAFAEQIHLAHERDLPLIIHTRDAWDDTFAVLDVLSELAKPDLAARQRREMEISLERTKSVVGAYVATEPFSG